MLESINFINVEFFFRLLDPASNTALTFLNGPTFGQAILPRVLFIIVGILALIGMIYVLVKRFSFKTQADEQFFSKFDELAGKDSKASLQAWNDILGHLENTSSASWSLAVIEADKVLDDVLNKAGCSGTSVGEKLKGISRADLNSLDEAWAAHKVRNRIAHESNYVISQHEAREAVKNYQKVLTELGCF
ncbi:MAG: hypothetical protein WC797_02590 [Candidatus Paceibacterota bacterium]|jgi:hypothetical protein